jgi:hypothetical protein
MKGNRRRRSLAIAVAGAALGALWLAPTASGVCANFHGDPPPGYSGPIQRGIACDYDAGGEPEEAWTVPTTVSEAEFWVLGADDPAVGRGGSVRATLAVAPGEVLTLLLGSNGGATTVSRPGVLLLRGAGGNGLESNYAFPGATDVQMQPAEGPNPPYPGAGTVYISWYEGWVDMPDGRTTKPPVGRCEVPKLRGLKPPVARRALAAADCSAQAFARKPARRPMRGRIVGQLPRAGTILPAGSLVAATVGRRP